MANQEIKKEQPLDAKAEQVVNSVSPEQHRLDRIRLIDQQLASFVDHPVTEAEIVEIQKKAEEEYQKELQKLEAELDQPLSEDSKNKIRQNIVDARVNLIMDQKKIFERLEAEKIILEYLNRTLANEKSESFISREMNKDCKVAVLIPVYNENTSNILRSLSSLSEQEAVDPKFFEIDLIVNNRQTDAKQKTKAFFSNQEAINLIKFINGESQEIPGGLTSEQLEQIEKIRKAKIIINVIDKSSVEVSDQENNVGTARNRAGAEIVDRFMKSSGNAEGVVAITDCDCVFSNNYIQSLISSFGEHKIIGVSGNLEFEVDPELSNSDLIQRAFDIYMGKDGPKRDYSGETSFQLQTKGTLQSGANMAVPAKVWAQVGGMPPLAGGEDIRFGQGVEKLGGQIAKNYDYTITSLIRVSERTGVQGNGRIVKKIKESVDAFVSGASDKVVIEDREKVGSFFAGVIKASQEERLTGRLLMDLMAQNNFKPNELPETEYSELADEINRELSKLETARDFSRIERMILEKIYPFYPEKNITNKLVEK
ncbi:MAG: glycosyltransferase family A protein [Patescibacteria group bacterium]|jgi:GT2 family glycosyltransferase